MLTVFNAIKAHRDKKIKKDHRHDELVHLHRQSRMFLALKLITL